MNSLKSTSDIPLNIDETASSVELLPAPSRKETLVVSEYVSQLPPTEAQLIADSVKKLWRLTFIAVGLNLLAVLSLAFFGVAIWKLAHRPLPQLVQMADGEMLPVQAADPLYRDPETIKKFVGEVSYLLYSWVGQLKDSDGKIRKDEGMIIDSQDNVEMRIPTPSFEASFALNDNDNYRTAHLKQYYKFLSQYVPIREIWLGEAYVSFEQGRLIAPELIAPGRWKLKQTAILLIVDRRTPAGRAVPFNREVYVQAIDNPLLPLGESATYIQRTIHNIRRSNLEIYDIRYLEKDR